jgi:hypothetical protein
LPKFLLEYADQVKDLRVVMNGFIDVPLNLESVVVDQDCEVDLVFYVCYYVGKDVEDDFVFGGEKAEDSLGRRGSDFNRALAVVGSFV